MPAKKEKIKKVPEIDFKEVERRIDFLAEKMIQLEKKFKEKISILDRIKIRMGL